jgi:xanthosine phosphorylase
VNEHEAAAGIIRCRLGGLQPRIGLVLGSGLGQVADAITQPVVVPYRDLPGFPAPTVEGHAGRVVAGVLEGVEIVCLQGRSHAYEGHAPPQLALPVRTLRAFGCEILLLTNAAGSLRPEMGPGSLMAIADHINWSGMNPLIGPNDPGLGPRFFDLTEAYDAAIRNQLRAAATEIGIELYEGVYVMVGGPNYETPAEVRALARLGGDAVGMSTVPEVLAARHCGLRVGAISLITNLGAGLGGRPLDHDEVLAAGKGAATRLTRLLARCLPEITIS